MSIIELKKEVLDSWIEQMPEDAAKVFRQLLMMYQSKRVIKNLKQWVEDLDDENPLDVMLSNLVLNIVCEIGSSVEEMVRNCAENGGHPIKATEIAIGKLRKCADDIETHLDDEIPSRPLWH